MMFWLYFQVLSLGYYSISYFPGGSAGMRFLTSALTSKIMNCFGRWFVFAFGWGEGRGGRIRTLPMASWNFELIHEYWHCWVEKHHLTLPKISMFVATSKALNEKIVWRLFATSYDLHCIHTGINTGIGMDTEGWTKFLKLRVREDISYKNITIYIT